MRWLINLLRLLANVLEQAVPDDGLPNTIRSMEYMFGGQSQKALEEVTVSVYKFKRIINSPKDQWPIYYRDNRLNIQSFLAVALAIEAQIDLQLEMYKEALRCLTESLEVVPIDSENSVTTGNDIWLKPRLSYRAVVYFQLGQYNLCILDLIQAIKLKPDDAGLHNYLGEAYRHVNDTESAIREYKKAVELDSHNPLAYYNLGFLYYQMNMPYLAVYYYLQGFVNERNALLALRSLSVKSIVKGTF